MPSADSLQLLNRLRSNRPEDREAAIQAIFDRYFQRLWRLAWNQLHPRLRQRVDPEDLINSGIKSLVFDFQAGKEFLRDKDSLWGLLTQAVITKVRQAAREHRAQKRDVFREVAPAATEDAGDPVWDYLATAEPTPHDALCLQEAMDRLPDDLQAVAMGKLYGKTDDEVAHELGYRSSETIRIAKRKIENLWQDYFGKT